MEVFEKTEKQELIQAINASNDDKLIKKLLFQIQPKVVLDKSKKNRLSPDQARKLSKEKILSWWGK